MILSQLNYDTCLHSVKACSHLMRPLVFPTRSSSLETDAPESISPHDSSWRNCGMRKVWKNKTPRSTKVQAHFPEAYKASRKSEPKVLHVLTCTIFDSSTVCLNPSCQLKKKGFSDSCHSNSKALCKTLFAFILCKTTFAFILCKTTFAFILCKTTFAFILCKTTFAFILYQ
jgi:hypothetical protein